jgi:hypothetical protein
MKAETCLVNRFRLGNAAVALVRPDYYALPPARNEESLLRDTEQDGTPS